jgi:hypothetical protein
MRPVSTMLGQTYSLIVLVIEPVDLEIIIGINGIKIPTKYQTSIVVVLLDVCI